MPDAVRAKRSVDSLDYTQFEKQLRRYFSERQTKSIISNLPASCKIFGFDAGDYSGDGAQDIVLSARADEHEKREVGVYFFVGRGEEFELIKTMNRRYLSEPIEIGFSVESGICSVTQKLGEYHWRITGYSFAQSVFKVVTLWETQRLPGGREFSQTGMEIVNDYRTNRSTESYFRASDSKSLFRSEFDAMPVFPASYQPPEDVRAWIGDSSSTPLLRGSSSWYGVEDCGVFTAASWDSTTLFLRVALFDDRILTGDSIAASDYLDLRFDVSGKGKVDAAGRPRAMADADVLGLRFVPFETDTMGMRSEFLGSWGAREQLRKAVRSAIRRVDYRSFEITCALPMKLFKAFGVPSRYSFAVLYHDVDNPDHPDWVTVASSSPRFEEGNPSTYGRMDFLPQDEVPYEREDYRLLPIVSRMDQAGLRH
jgi:hypothetical protein